MRHCSRDKQRKKLFRNYFQSRNFFLPENTDESSWDVTTDYEDLSYEPTTGPNKESSQGDYLIVPSCRKKTERKTPNRENFSLFTSKKLEILFNFQIRTMTLANLISQQSQSMMIQRSDTQKNLMCFPWWVRKCFNLLSTWITNRISLKL